jgi:FAD:protein FMN transferase
MERRIVGWLLGVIVPAVSWGAEPELCRFEFTHIEMAVPMKIVLSVADSATATRAAEAAFARIRALNAIMSDYDETSELRRLCTTAGEGKAIPVSDELWKVLAHAQTLSAESDGAFDVTVGPVVRLWRRARRQKELPAAEALEAARRLVDYRLVRLDPQRRAVELLKPGMRLDLGGIAKGYALDEALAVLTRQGAARALLDAGGDIRLGDPPPGQPGWRIGLTPLEANARATSYLVASRVAVATSGDAMQFVQIGGRRYSHIVDPHTGIGLTDHSRVTVVGPDGITADGLSTAVSVLGPERGLKLIEKTPGTAAMFLRAPQGKVERYESKRWRELTVIAAEEG